jgi:Protein of unknown function (DUF3499)
MISGPSWGRRYGPNARRLCARPGCGSPAAATLRFQPTQREAWLVDLDDDDARTEGDLCSRHAAGLVLPRGWQLHNDLSAERDDSVPPTAPVPRARASIARARRRRTSSTAVALPGMSAVADAEAETPPAAPDGTPLVADATPEASVALAETLDARTPLLRRAFSNVYIPEAENDADAEPDPNDDS